MEQEILLIRHTSVEYPRGFCYGNTDVDVSSNFEAEASWLQNQLTEYVPDKIYSSPLKRCTKLASFLFGETYTTDNRLKELNYGSWEGLTWAEIDVAEDNNYIFHNSSTVLENGESFEIQKARVLDFFGEIEKSEDRRIAIVVHGGVIRSLISGILDIPLKNTKAFKIHYASQVKFIKENGNWRLSGIASGI